MIMMIEQWCLATSRILDLSFACIASVSGFFFASYWRVDITDLNVILRAGGRDKERRTKIEKETKRGLCLAVRVFVSVVVAHNACVRLNLCRRHRLSQDFLWGGVHFF